MITKRIIPCLDVRDGRVVKGVNFEGIQDVSDPVALARHYSESGADELVFYDITASFEGRKLFTDILTRTASQIFIPLTVGGGINTLDDFDRVLSCGADKVSVNSGAIRNPDLVGEAAKRFGDQCVVISADVKRVDGSFHVFAKGGREDTGMDGIEWIRRCVDNGAGEVVLNSIDTDGVKNGFDLEMLQAVCDVGHRLRRRRRHRPFRRTVPGHPGCRRRSRRQHLPLRRSRDPRPQGRTASQRHQRQIIEKEFSEWKPILFRSRN